MALLLRRNAIDVNVVPFKSDNGLKSLKRFAFLFVLKHLKKKKQKNKMLSKCHKLQLLSSDAHYSPPLF